VGLAVAILAGGIVAAALGAGLGYLTLRIRGVYFSIATLAVAIVLLNVIVNTPQLGGAKGLYIHRLPPMAPFASYIEVLFATMVAMAVGAVAIARVIEKSRIGRGLAAIRDNEDAAECLGVPVFRLKLFATTVSGFLMGIAGAPYPLYITYLEPHSAMGLDITLNSLAMALVGGTMTWIGPVIGAVFLGTMQQAVTVTVSSEFNLLIVGVLLMVFVIVAPDGVVGLYGRLRKLVRR
jgi:branched-chain amino acid transport system permease protein